MFVCVSVYMHMSTLQNGDLCVTKDLHTGDLGTKGGPDSGPPFVLANYCVLMVDFIGRCVQIYYEIFLR